MKWSSWTSDVLKARRMSKRMLADGYERVEGPWQLHRGGRQQEVITEAIIDVGGKDIWVKTQNPA